MQDIIIVGGGPAGLTAAVYGALAGHKTILFEGRAEGGQMATASSVENYTGFPQISGFDLTQKMAGHAREAGAEVKYLFVDALSLTPGQLGVEAGGERFGCRTLILAMGAAHKRLGVPGEDRLSGCGVSYCATCDGNFFKNRTVAVIGGGNSALKDALYLANICEKVVLAHRTDELRGVPSNIEAVLAHEKIERIPQSVVTAITGDKTVDGIDVRSTASGATLHIPVSGVFVAVGAVAQSALVEGLLELDKSGRVIAPEDCKTGIDGVFVAGDIRAKSLYQIATAVADGAVAASGAGKFLIENKK